MKAIAILIAVGVTAIAFAIAPLGHAARPFKGLFSGEKHEGAAEVKMAVLRHVLNFRKETPMTAEQKEKAGAVLKSHQKEIRAMFERGREVRQTMRETAIAKGPDDVATKAAADAVGNLARDRALLLAKIGTELRPVLTEEQLKRLQSAREEIEPMVDELFSAALKSE